MTEPQARSGVHAWDESDARSIASNTPSYGGALFRTHSTFSPVAQQRIMPSASLRIASAMMACFRFKPRPETVG